jgi:acyl carrier protein
MIRTDARAVEAAVKEYILSEFLPGEAPEALTETTPLLTTGILDSIATLKLVSFLESRFKISIAAHEVNVDHLNSLETIVELVGSKQGGAPA